MLILMCTFAISATGLITGATLWISSSNIDQMIMLNFAHLHPQLVSCLSWRLQMSKGYFPIMQRILPVMSALAQGVSEYFSSVQKP